MYEGGYIDESEKLTRALIRCDMSDIYFMSKYNLIHYKRTIIVKYKLIMRGNDKVEMTHL